MYPESIQIRRETQKSLRHTTMFTYSHANTPLGQSERANYLSYFIKVNCSYDKTFLRILWVVKKKS